jgi:hypothetical protein
MAEADPKSLLKVTFEPAKMQVGLGWYVLVTFPDGEKTQIYDFNTKAEARDWIANKSASWLEGYKGGRYL